MVAARQWMLSGETTDKGKGQRARDNELQTVTHSIAALAKRFRTSNSTISQARDLLAEAPDLAAMVEANSLSLARASEQLDERRRRGGAAGAS